MPICSESKLKALLSPSLGSMVRRKRLTEWGDEGLRSRCQPKTTKDSTEPKILSLRQKETRLFASSCLHNFNIKAEICVLL